jgi:glutamate-1-semialdehyde 2,1-aminomutase
MSRNESLFEAARQVLPGGVSSPVRAFKSVGGTPLTLRSGKGAIVKDADGREYVDMVCGWGAQILGHADDRVVAALRRRAGRGTVFGAPAIEETQLARILLPALPGHERVRFVNSGTEATMSALRLARAATGRDLIVKFAGCYHGHADALLSSAGSGALTLGTPDSPGVPAEWAGMTLTATYNDADSVRALFEAHGEQIAAVILEPVVGNMGCIPPGEGFLADLRQITRDHGALLVIDEVMTGFRVAWGGAQVRFGVQPDLTCLGKVIGGGMPVGAYAGPAALMDQVAPAGPVYQAGTLSGNPISMAAGIATLRALRGSDAYDRLESSGAAIESVLRSSAAAAGVPVRIQRVGSMMTVFFTDGDAPIANLDMVKATRTDLFGVWHAALLQHGVSWPPSAFEAAFISVSHDAAVIDRIARAAVPAFQAVATAS